MRVAIFGGTGKFGTGLARRITAVGVHEVAIASRDLQKAETAAKAYGNKALGMTHSAAASWCEMAVIATPYAGHASVLESIREAIGDKVVIDATVPLDPSDPTKIRSVSGTSAAEEAAAVLSSARVFAAFHTLSHRVLPHAETSHDGLVAGSEDGKQPVFEFMRSLNLRPIHAGPLAVARLLECMTALLIAINKQNKTRESGIQIVGV